MGRQGEVKSVKKTNFNGGEFSNLVQPRQDLEKYETGVKTMKNFIASPYGSAMNRPGTQYIGRAKLADNKDTRLVPFVFSTVQAYILEVGEYYIRFWKDDGLIEAGGSPVEVATPYASSDIWDLVFRQSFDTVFITHPSYTVRQLTRSSHVSWQFTEVDFGASIGTPTNVAAGGAESVSYGVSAVSNAGEESVISDADEGYTGVSNTFSISWDAVTDARYYNIYRKAGAPAANETAYGYLGWAGTNAFAYNHETPITIDYNQSPILEERIIFNGAGNYPGASAFFGQRLLFGGTANEPQKIWGSRVGVFRNFNERILLRDDDPYEFEINSLSMNEIRWMIPLNDLIIGTPVTVFRMSPGRGSDAVTPNSVDIKPQVYSGVAKVEPVVIGNEIVFVDVARKKVVSLKYTYETETYQDRDLALYASHLFDDSTIREIAYQDSPNRIVWAVMADGTLRGLTYFKDHDISGWHQHDTQGEFKSVIALPRTDGGKDVYFLVARGGAQDKAVYIEKLAERLPTTDLEDTVFLDMSLTTDFGSDVTTVSGLDEHEGFEVKVLADGFVETHTVSGGEITLDNPAQVVTVGLAYDCVLETLELDYETEHGSILDKRRMVKSVVVSLDKTSYLKVGPDADSLLEVPIRLADTVPEDHTEPVSQSYEVNLLDGSGDSSQVYFLVDQPYPATITGLTARIESSDYA